MLPGMFGADEASFWLALGLITGGFLLLAHHVWIMREGGPRFRRLRQHRPRRK